MAAGRPRKFESVEEMQIEIDKYFKQCKTDDDPATVQGLALALGYNSRQSLLNYEGYSDEFLDTIKRAKLRIENAKITGALKGKLNPTIVIFDLKNNHDHKDKTETEFSGALPVVWQEQRNYQTKEATGNVTIVNGLQTKAGIVPK